MVDRFDMYLGLPTRIGCSKVEVFNYLKDKLWARVKGWQEKNLSIAGREILVKAIQQAIPTYVMFCFRSNQRGFRGYLGCTCVDQRQREDWVFEIWKVSILPFQRSKHGGLPLLRSFFCLKLLKLVLSELKFLSG